MIDHHFLQQLGIFTRPGFLSDEECAHWRALAASGGAEAKVYNSSEGMLNVQQRKTLEIDLKDPRRGELEERIVALRPDLERHFGVALNELDQLACLKYRTGDFFRLHADVPQSGSAEEAAKFPTIYRRSVAIVIFLNHPSHAAEPYAGGTLSLRSLMDFPGSQEFVVPVEAETGLLIAFPAATLHEVSPVTAGHRYTLVAWFLSR